MAAAGSLTAPQALDAAAKAAGHLFGGVAAQLGGMASGTAGVNLADLQAAVQALDSALNTTLNAAVTAGFGADTVIQALQAQLAAPVNGLTGQQQTIILCYCLLKRAGLV